MSIFYRLEVLERDKEKVVVRSGDNKAVITAEPIRIEFFKNDVLVAVVNDKGLFNMEHLRPKASEGLVVKLGKFMRYLSIFSEGEAEHTKEDPGAWEENFKSHHDSKPRGPEAVGVDVTFPGALRIYGLPEHADKLALRTTQSGGLDPYRLYNLDVFEYEVDSTMALYGAIPVVYAHS